MHYTITTIDDVRYGRVSHLGPAEVHEERATLYRGNHAISSITRTTARAT